MISADPSWITPCSTSLLNVIVATLVLSMRLSIAEFPCRSVDGSFREHIAVARVNAKDTQRTGRDTQPIACTLTSTHSQKKRDASHLGKRLQGVEFGILVPVLLHLRAIRASRS